MQPASAKPAARNPANARAEYDSGTRPRRSARESAADKPRTPNRATASEVNHDGARLRRSDTTNLMPSNGEMRPAIQAGMNIASSETIGPSSPAVMKGTGVIRKAGMEAL